MPRLTAPKIISDFDLHLIGEGTHTELYRKLGAHPLPGGVHFAVWAPNAGAVSVLGDFNEWKGKDHGMKPLGNSGIWELFVPDLETGAFYKFEVRHKNGRSVLKADPMAFLAEVPPRSASVVWDSDRYRWSDAKWMRQRAKRDPLEGPITIYECHLGSWRRKPEEGDRPLTYRELAGELIPYVKSMGFTHVEFMPVTEHPFGGSWGYQTTGYFAATSRYGPPEDLMYLIDQAHAQGIGVILDWVPSHFATDEHGLGRFDGTSLYEHEDSRQGFHPDWHSYIFNYGRAEVRNFLTASALYWLKVFHIDGLRVDAVASMLYLDYSRKEGEWIPNRFGGRENLEAVDFLKNFNSVVHKECPGILTIAEESTTWPMVSRPVYLGGLGFSIKWNMGWMHDIIDYFSKDPIHRRFEHNRVTFSLVYAFSENFMLALSHDEVVHGKGSLIGKMPGDDWKKSANLRALYGLMAGHPGKKCLFMGNEFAQKREWNHDASLDWHLLEEKSHRGVKDCVAALNGLVRDEPALHENDFDGSGFEWIDCNDAENSVLSFIRWDRKRRRPLLFVCNLTPVVRRDYRIGIIGPGKWVEILTTDAKAFGGSGVDSGGPHTAEKVPSHGRERSLSLTLPPLAVMVFKPAV